MGDGEEIAKGLLGVGIEVGLLISGFFGALMMVSRDATKRIGSTVASLLAGTACANYLTPVVLNLLPEAVRGQGKYACAFVMGFMGLKGLEMLIDRFVRKPEVKRPRRTRRRKGGGPG
jgi:hypothetical protein